MKFATVSLDEAHGAILAHGLALEGFRLKKGHVLTSGDLAKLEAAGETRVTVALLGPDDIEENEAARRVSAALSSQNIEPGEAFTGRVNLHVAEPGIFFASSDVVDSINAVSPTITLATLPNGVFVEAGQMVATVKIIPFAAAQEDIERAVGHARNGRAFSLVRSRPKKVGLIATQLPTLKPSTMDKTAGILSDRLARAGSALHAEIRVAHQAAAVAEALTQLEGECDLLIVFGASAISDLEDVIPAGLISCGGEVLRFGMPVDPGNLLLLGTLGATPVIGAPGCARSPAENGFDWVLQRLLADVEVTPQYIEKLGVGGLLKEISTRPQPREG